MRYLITKVKLSLICLILSVGCASLPPFPNIYQCVYRHDKAAFFCVNTETKARLKIPESAPSMKAAQCVSPSDFKAVQAWISEVQEIAAALCR